MRNDRRHDYAAGSEEVKANARTRRKTVGRRAGKSVDFPKSHCPKSWRRFKGLCRIPRAKTQSKRFKFIPPTPGFSTRIPLHEQRQKITAKKLVIATEYQRATTPSSQMDWARSSARRGPSRSRNAQVLKSSAGASACECAHFFRAFAALKDDLLVPSTHGKL